ncbi:MAG: type II secretion system protein [Candidatus Shapirobacteria bacterium]|nr:type II secretion system protein [Candidatus Shapirobacteria bacterium]
MRKYSAFTLLELLIVIAIIGILASLATVSYSSAQRRARDSQRQADLKAIQNAMEQYYADYDGNYPLTCDGIGGAQSPSGESYLPTGLPTDPKSGEEYEGNCTNAGYSFSVDLESSEENFVVSNLQ